MGSAILLALLVAAGLFILQTYAASLFVLDRTSFPAGAPTDEAFYDISALVGGPVFKAIVSIIGVTLAGISGALAAQGAAARLLYGMARDERVPIFLAHISRERRVPSYALLAVAMLTLSVGVALVNHLELLASTVSFGAVVGFMMLHVSVIVHYTLRKRSRKWLRHLVVPLTGIAVLLYVLVNAQPQAKIAGTVWLLIGTLMLAIQTKKSAPVLSQ